jgi:hypothetical protein
VTWAKKSPCGVDALAEELEYYREKKEELLQYHKNKFALIKGKQLVGTFDDQREAFKEGIHQLGNVPFLIRQVVEDEPIASIPVLTLGITDANLSLH